MFAEHASQGRNYTNFDWTTIIFDTCAGRDSRIYPCLIDATQADIKLCDLLSKTQPFKLDIPEMLNEPNGYTGFLTKTSVYWPMSINDEGIILRSSYDMNVIDSILIGNELDTVNGKYFHISVDQRAQIPTFYIGSKSSIDNRIHRIRLKEQKVTTNDLFANVKIERRCQWCYFTTDGPDIIYVAMDSSNSIERYENNGGKTLSISLPAPSGMIIRNHDLWIVNGSQLIILAPRRLANGTVTYRIINQIGLASLYSLPITNPLILSGYSSFMAFHLDVDNYGRVYITGALLDLQSANDRKSPGENPQLYILSNGEQKTRLAVCAGPWGMFGVSVYHSKLKLHMLTSMDNFFFNLYSSH